MHIHTRSDLTLSVYSMSWISSVAKEDPWPEGSRVVRSGTPASPCMPSTLWGHLARQWCRMTLAEPLRETITEAALKRC